MTRTRAPVFLDRDGTLIIEREYLGDPEGVTLEHGVIEGLSALYRDGHPLVVLSNQSGVGRGLFDADAVRRVNARIADLLRPHGIDILAWYMCPHLPEAGCRCRKPSPGMAVEAGEEWQLTLTGSYVVGDKRADLELADAIGATGILLTTGHGAASADWARRRSSPVFATLRDAAAYITTQAAPSTAPVAVS